MPSAAASAPASDSDQVYFSSTTNVTDILVSAINAETVRLDVSSWYLSEHSISIAIANRFAAGVPVRVECSGNFAPTELAPNSATDYDDDSEMFTTDPVLVNAFKTEVRRDVERHGRRAAEYLWCPALPGGLERRLCQ